MRIVILYLLLLFTVAAPGATPEILLGTWHPGGRAFEGLDFELREGGVAKWKRCARIPYQIISHRFEKHRLPSPFDNLALEDTTPRDFHILAVQLNVQKQCNFLGEVLEFAIRTDALCSAVIRPYDTLKDFQEQRPSGWGTWGKTPC